jgi:hypothetical protein
LAGHHAASGAAHLSAQALHFVQQGVQLPFQLRQSPFCIRPSFPASSRQSRSVALSRIVRAADCFHFLQRNEPRLCVFKPLQYLLLLDP